MIANPDPNCRLWGDLVVHSAAQKSAGGSTVAWPSTWTVDQKVAQAGTEYRESWSASMMSAGWDLRTARSSGVSRQQKTTPR